MVNTNNQITINLRFPGQYYDQETGLHYDFFRDYNPKTGRYIQSDPIGLDGGINTFAYAVANPLYWTDSQGLALDTVTNWCRRNPILPCMDLGFGFLPRPKPGTPPPAGQPENCPGNDSTPFQQPGFPPIFTSTGDDRGCSNPTNSPAAGGTGSPNNGCNPNDPNCGREYREHKSGQSGKESKNDIPSWAKGQRPYKGENGKQFAKRVLDNFYGKNGWSGTGPRSEFNQLKKFADSAFIK